MSRFKQITTRVPKLGERKPSGLPEGMVPADKITSVARAQAAAEATSEPTDSELLARRERLTERFAAGQAELGGILYEMAIRDHVRLDVLVNKAAALQRVDLELAEVERELRGDIAEVAGHCPSCGTRHAKDARFCSGCGSALPAASTTVVPALTNGTRHS